MSEQNPAMPTLEVIYQFVTDPAQFEEFKRNAGAYLEAHDVEPEAARALLSVPAGGTLDSKAVGSLVQVLASELAKAIQDGKLIW